MKFSIITPTHRRQEGLKRAVQSLVRQTYIDWELIIINDSPDDRSYQEFSSFINDPRIHYHVNSRNLGVNQSRNVGLDKVSADSKWIIFLDDDDYLSPDTLFNFRDLILIHGDSKWFVTNRALNNGTPLTRFPGSDKHYSYSWKYLIFKRCKGDATHCIESNLIRQIRFSKTVKHGEEWFFFYQVGLKSKMYYSDHNSTITDGYDKKMGLNFRKRSISEQLETVSKISYEGYKLRLLKYPTFILYIFLRTVRAFFKN